MKSSIYSAMIRAMPPTGDGSEQSVMKQSESGTSTVQELNLTQSNGHVVPSPNNTLLPRPVASLVSLFAQSTSLSLRVGTYLGGFAIDSARVTTLTGLELSRAVVEGILVKAGRDITLRSAGDYGRIEAESLLERSVSIY